MVSFLNDESKEGVRLLKMDSISSRKRGWRRTAVVSTISTLCCGTLLLIILVIVISQGDSNLFSTAIIFKGDCRTTKIVNSLLHLLLNLISGLILASSRFFMQILSSPSRQEVGRAHLQLRSLDIGVPSVKNFLFISPVKAVGWMVLLISSVPIHLFFNSSIFETDFQGSDWRLTIATHSFTTQEAAFFPPGVCLATAGIPKCEWAGGYGKPVDMAEYWHTSSAEYENITKAASQSRLWHNISSQDCLDEYASCKPKKKYRDVVVIVDTGADNPDGWKQSDFFSDTFDPLGSMWNSHIPPNDINSLWYSAQCATHLPISPMVVDRQVAVCVSTCGLVLGLGSAHPLTNTSTSSAPSWRIDAYPPLSCGNTYQEKQDEPQKSNGFDVRYCLAEPSPDYACRVGLVNILLLATIICVFWKVITCILIIYYLPSASLVTPGDALASFISHPDPVTLGLGTFSIPDSRRLQYGPPAYFGSELEHFTGLSDTIQPRLWRRKTDRLMSAIPKAAWSSSFAPIFFFLGVGGYYAYELQVNYIPDLYVYYYHIYT